MADPRINTTDSERIAQIISDIWVAIKELQRPTGTELAQTVKKIFELFDNLDTAVQNSIAANSYTKAQIDSRIGSTPGSVQVNGDHRVIGNQQVDGSVTTNGGATLAGGSLFVNAGDVTASGIGTFVASRNLVLTTGYAGLWMDVAGRIGISPSSVRYKVDIEHWEGTPIEELYKLRAVMFRYDPELFGTDPDGQKQLGFIAEELFALGFPEFISYDEFWNIQGINYDRLSVALLVLAQKEHADRLEYQRVTDSALTQMKSQIEELTRKLDSLV